MNYLYSTVNTLRDRYTPVRNRSTFRQTGEITPDEFLAAGDYLVYKFPTWSWGDADDHSRRVSHLPPGKQFLVTRNVPCHRRWNEGFAGDAGHEETIIADGEDFKKSSRAGSGGGGGASGDDDGGDDGGWLQTGGLTRSQSFRIKNIRAMHEGSNLIDSSMVEEEEIPDMEEEDDDEAIIRDAEAASETNGRRTYNLYIMYSPFYRTPRLYLSGYLPNGQPLPPKLMMDDIVGDYKDKTVTVEDFPFFGGSVKMASVHPCKHASVMKTLLDRADSALRRRRERRRAADAAANFADESASNVDVGGVRGVHDAAVESKGGASASASGDDWEEVKQDDVEDEEVAIRVDQYLVVFLKFMASMTPGIEHDATMSV